MIRPRSLLGCAILLCALAGTAWAAPPRLGVASLRGDGTACVSVRGEPLRSGDRLLIVLFSPPRIVDGTVQEGAADACDSVATVAGEVYTVALRFNLDPRPEHGIAVFAPGGRAEYADGSFVLHTFGAAHPLSFRSCHGSEGLHLSAWRGNRRTWHEYLYLGLDLQADCSSDEARP